MRQQNWVALIIQGQTFVQVNRDIKEYIKRSLAMSYNNVLDRLNRKKRNLAMSYNNLPDRFSSLPEDILSRILSLMPTKYAVRTSILSRSWRYRWMLVTNLDFDNHTNTIYGLYAFTSFVERVLKLCKTSQVKVFRLHSPEIEGSYSRVSNWVHEAVRLNVCELDIQVMRMELPLSMLTCKTLTKLRLDMSSVDAYNMREEFLCQVYLPCLKTLDITFHNNPFVTVFTLVNRCPMLESLSWEVVHSHEDEEDYIFNIPTLKRLKLTLRNCASVINKVVLHVPNLEYLFVGGILSSVYVMEDVSSLVEASVSISEIRFGNHNVWDKLLKGLSGVKSLSVQNIPFTFRLPRFLNMKHLKLRSSWNSGPIFQFLESSPELKHVDIEKLQESPWIEPKLVPVCILTNLTTVKFSISKWWKCDTSFLEYMVGNAEVLKTLTVTSEYSSNIKEEKQLCAELLKFPRASRCCEMHFHGN